MGSYEEVLVRFVMFFGRWMISDERLSKFLGKKDFLKDFWKLVEYFYVGVLFCKVSVFV